MADVRAAFDTVRAALNLGNDTVLFGVPVDSDSAFANVDAVPAIDVAEMPETLSGAVTESEPETKSEINTEPDCESDVATETQSAPVAPRRRGRPRMKKVDDTPAVPEVEPQSDTASKVVPILSVLAAKSTDASDTDNDGGDDAAMDDDDVVNPAVTNDDNVDPSAPEVTICDVNLDAELVAPGDAFGQPMRVTIGEMIVDAAPTMPAEKTLEQLLESMTPLCDEHNADMPPAFDDDKFDSDIDVQPDAADATLEKLATEFAESEPEIIPQPKTTSGGGKIGKLKNILPFKKARRDDSGLMGDLFNWAGIAANDEEFAIPGFFANATTNK